MGQFLKKQVSFLGIFIKTVNNKTIQINIFYDFSLNRHIKNFLKVGNIRIQIAEGDSLGRVLKPVDDDLLCMRKIRVSNFGNFPGSVIHFVLINKFSAQDHTLSPFPDTCGVVLQKPLIHNDNTFHMMRQDIFCQNMDTELFFQFSLLYLLPKNSILGGFQKTIQTPQHKHGQDDLNVSRNFIFNLQTLVKQGFMSSHLHKSRY